jgi:hypothetical protein
VEVAEQQKCSQEVSGTRHLQLLVNTNCPHQDGEASEVEALDGTD